MSSDAPEYAAVREGDVVRLLRVRADYGERSYFTGPLGIWPWPIVNLILAVVEAIRARIYYRPTEVYRPRPRTVQYNIVRDEKGRIISIEEVYV